MNHLKMIIRSIQLFGLVFFVSLLSGCFEDESNIYIEYETIYDEVNDQTQIIWLGEIENHSIYDIKSISIEFNLYLNETWIRSTNIQQVDIFIPHGKSKVPSLSGIAEGEINEIRLVSWSAEYESLFDTYQEWLIGSCVVVSLVFLGSLIYISLEDIDIEDFFAWLEEEIFWLKISISASALTGTIYSFITSQWGYTMIIASVTIISFLVILLAFGIKSIYSAIAD